MISKLKQLFEDIRAIRLWLTSGPVVHLSESDRNLLQNYRRYKPRTKKETV